jgi:N utilization substance protein B
MKLNKNNPRLIIVQLLYSYSLNSQKLLFDFKNPYKRFIKKMCNGVIENNSVLEKKLIEFLDQKFDIKKFEVIFILILKSAIYEIFFYKKTPFKVVIDEYLNISKMFLNDKQKNIVNAVLDKIAKTT